MALGRFLSSSSSSSTLPLLLACEQAAKRLNTLKVDQINALRARWGLNSGASLVKSVKVETMAEFLLPYSRYSSALIESRNGNTVLPQSSSLSSPTSASLLPPSPSAALQSFSAISLSSPSTSAAFESSSAISSSLPLPEEVISIDVGTKNMAWVHMDSNMQIRGWLVKELALPEVYNPRLLALFVHDFVKTLPPVPKVLIERQQLRSNLGQFPMHIIVINVIEALLHAYVQADTECMYPAATASMFGLGKMPHAPIVDSIMDFFPKKEDLIQIEETRIKKTMTMKNKKKKKNRETTDADADINAESEMGTEMQESARSPILLWLQNQRQLPEDIAQLKQRVDMALKVSQALWQYQVNHANNTKKNKGSYSSKKNMACQLVMQWMSQNRVLQVSPENQAMFEQVKKRDDLSDCAIQGVAYYIHECNRRVDAHFLFDDLLDSINHDGGQYQDSSDIKMSEGMDFSSSIDDKNIKAMMDHDLDTNNDSNRARKKPKSRKDKNETPDGMENKENDSSKSNNGVAKKKDREKGSSENDKYEHINDKESKDDDGRKIKKNDISVTKKDLIKNKR